MKRINQGGLIDKALVSEACGQNCHLPPGAVLSSQMINECKHRFMAVARAVCPGFTIPDDKKTFINDIFNWCMLIPGRYNLLKGLWLWGDIGTGKTTMLNIIKAFCKTLPWRTQMLDGIWVEYSFRISNAIDVCSKFSKSGYPGIETFIESERQAFDELGSECTPTGYYGTAENVLQFILQRRYDKRFNNFTHVTTNLTIEQISERYGARIYDRCKEMFNFVEMRGMTWRRKN